MPASGTRTLAPDGPGCFPARGRVGIESPTANRSIAVNRRDAVFAGHDAGAENRAAEASLIEFCKMNIVVPQAWLASPDGGEKRHRRPRAEWPWTRWRRICESHREAGIAILPKINGFHVLPFNNQYRRVGRKLRWPSDVRWPERACAAARNARQPPKSGLSPCRHTAIPEGQKAWARA